MARSLDLHAIVMCSAVILVSCAEVRSFIRTFDMNLSLAPCGRSRFDIAFIQTHPHDDVPFSRRLVELSCGNLNGTCPAAS
ncbi:uncharacterized protein B0H18DRAFT_1064248, partial [Fomitopsis serialis]|uniref:uncharacterized protein n=1 Tax=Fomitopsis serialis TaxID=139415 RepID=UPI002007AA2C